MKPNLLLDPLPRDVEIDGKPYLIDTDFRVSMQFELLIQSDLSEEEKLANALMLYYRDEMPENLEEAVKKIIWFYGCGVEPKKKRRPVKKEESTEDPGQGEEDEEDDEVDDHRPIYSFEYDDAYIVGAFMTQYGIDLTDIDYMHWWKFRALFKSLQDTNQIVKIMGYRSAKITNDMSKKEQAFLRKMKRIHALPVSESEQKYTDALTQALINGEDVSKILSGG